LDSGIIQKITFEINQIDGFQLKWGKMKNMLFDVNEIWNNLKEDITLFIKNN
jgi:hypothetical protein